jgi:hypothetical protein
MQLFKQKEKQLDSGETKRNILHTKRKTRISLLKRATYVHLVNDSLTSYVNSTTLFQKMSFTTEPQSES